MCKELERSKNRFNFITIFVFFVAFCFFTAPNVLAAEFSLVTDNKEIKLGDQFEVKVVLNSENESINAVEGAIVFPQSLVDLKDIKNGNSIISFWSQAPRLTGNQVSFSGLVPGGYAGRTGLVLSLIFQAKTENGGVIDLTKAVALLNDGKGTEAKVRISNLQLVVKGQATEPKVVASPNDTDPPEEFSPDVSQDETIFDGKKFLVFATQDKGSGIDYYEVCEGKRECVKAENVYLLQNQDLNEEIVVYAVDKSGNKRMAKFAPQKSTKWYAKPSYLAIIVVVLAAFVVWKRKR